MSEAQCAACGHSQDVHVGGPCGGIRPRPDGDDVPCWCSRFREPGADPTCAHCGHTRSTHEPDGCGARVRGGACWCSTFVEPTANTWTVEGNTVGGPVPPWEWSDQAELEQAADRFVRACQAVDERGAELERVRARYDETCARRESAREALVDMVGRLLVARGDG